MAQIMITVPRDGIAAGTSAPRIETSGYTGGACRTASEAFEKLLGGRIEETLTSEFYETQQSVERLGEGE